MEVKLKVFKGLMLYTLKIAFLWIFSLTSNRNLIKTALFLKVSHFINVHVQWDSHSHKSGKLLEATEDLPDYKKFSSKAKRENQNCWQKNKITNKNNWEKFYFIYSCQMPFAHKIEKECWKKSICPCQVLNKSSVRIKLQLHFLY